MIVDALLKFEQKERGQGEGQKIHPSYRKLSISDSFPRRCNSERLSFQSVFTEHTVCCYSHLMSKVFYMLFILPELTSSFKFTFLQVLCEFPDELRGDVSLHLHREILSLPIFETAPQGFLKLMSRSVKSNFCAPGE